MTGGGRGEAPSRKGSLPNRKRMAGVWSLRMAAVTFEGEAGGLQKSASTPRQEGLDGVGDVDACSQAGTAAAEPRSKSAEKRNTPRPYQSNDARLRSQSQCFSTVRTKQELLNRSISQPFPSVQYTSSSGSLIDSPSARPHETTESTKEAASIMSPRSPVDGDVRTLHSIIKRGDLKQLKKHIKVMKHGDRGHTDVLHAKSRGNTPLHTATDARHIDMVKFLLKKGAKPDVMDSIGWTPLLVACKAGELAVAQVLLVQGKADANAKTDDLNTALHYLAVKPPKHEEKPMYYDVMTHLLGKEGKVYGKVSNNTSARNKHGDTPLHYAAMHSTPEVVKWLLEHHAPVNHQNANGETALHCAARRGDEEVVRVLLKHGASKTVASGKSKTPQDIVRAEHPEKESLIALLCS